MELGLHGLAGIAAWREADHGCGIPQGDEEIRIQFAGRIARHGGGGGARGRAGRGGKRQSRKRRVRTVRSGSGVRQPWRRAPSLSMKTGSHRRTAISSPRKENRPHAVSRRYARDHGPRGRGRSSGQSPANGRPEVTQPWSCAAMAGLSAGRICAPARRRRAGSQGVMPTRRARPGSVRARAQGHGLADENPSSSRASARAPDHARWSGR